MGGVGLGGQGGCERRIEVFVKKNGGGVRSGGGGGQWEGSGWGGQGGCERRIEVFVKLQKKKLGGGGVRSGGGGVRLGGGSVAEGVRCGGSGWWGFRMNVNAMLGVGVDVGYGGCEPRIEGIVQCTKRYCTILRK